MNEFQQIRLIQLAASLLLQQNDKLILSQADSALFDIIVETPGDKSICLVKVVDDAFMASEDYTAYMHELHSNESIEKLDGNPLCIIKLNEPDLSLDFQIIGWDDWGTYVIDDNINFHRLVGDNIVFLVDKIRKHNHIIKLLELGETKVVKSIRMNVDCYGHKVPAEIMYLRDFALGYNMAKIEPETEAEVREKRETGYFMRQYPSDILDKTILVAIKNKYPDASFYNSLLVTNVDYRKFVGIQRQYKHEEAEIRILPDFEDLPPEVVARMGRIEGLRFRLDIYIQPSPESHLYDNEGFEIRLPMKNWIATLNKYTEVLKTMHRVKDLV